MAHAVQQVVHEGKSPTDERDQSERTREQFRGRKIGLLAAGQRYQPIAEREESQRQSNPGQPMQNRQAIADLPSIDAQVRRSWSGACWHNRSVKNRYSGRAVHNRRSESAPVLRAHPPRAARVETRVAWVLRTVSGWIGGPIRDLLSSSSQAKVCQKKLIYKRLI